MLDLNLLNSVMIGAAVILLVRIVFPYLRRIDIGKNLYSDIKRGLLLFGYAFREEKIKRIVATLVAIITAIEQLDMAAEDKKAAAASEAYSMLSEEFNISLDDEAVNLIIDIIVSYLPPTH